MSIRSSNLTPFFVYDYNCIMQTLYDLKNHCTVYMLSEQTVWGMPSIRFMIPCAGTVYTLQADEVTFGNPAGGTH